MTELRISAKPSAVGRPKLYAKPILVKFAEGVVERIKPLLAKDEDRTDFVREAVEREIKRRERQPR